MRTINAPFKEAELKTLRDFCALAGDIKHLLVGAAARLLAASTGLPGLHVHGVRGTRDLDFGVMLGGKEDHQEFLNRLAGLFNRPAGPIVHYHKETGIRIDIIPYGGLAQDGRVSLPGGTNGLTVLGFEEAYRCAVEWSVGDEVTLRIASELGLFILKIIAYFDRKESRDIMDAWEILDAYGTLANQERFFESCLNELAEGMVSHDEAHYLLMGKDVSNISKPDTKQALLDHLERVSRPESPDIIRLAGLLGRHPDGKEHPPLLSRAFALVKTGLEHG